MMTVHVSCFGFQRIKGYPTKRQQTPNPIWPQHTPNDTHSLSHWSSSLLTFLSCCWMLAVGKFWVCAVKENTNESETKKLSSPPAAAAFDFFVSIPRSQTKRCWSAGQFSDGCVRRFLMLTYSLFKMQWQCCVEWLVSQTSRACLQYFQRGLTHSHV